MPEAIPNPRLDNLLLLIREKFEGRQVDFAHATNIRPPSVSQIINGRRNLGDALARRVEDRLGLPREWMDMPHDTIPDLLATIPPPPAGLLTQPGFHTRARLETEVMDIYIEQIAAIATANGATAIDSCPPIWSRVGIKRPDLLITFPDHTTAVDVVPDTSASRIDRIIADSVKLKGHRYVVVTMRPAATPHQQHIVDGLVDSGLVFAVIPCDSIASVKNVM